MSKVLIVNWFKMIEYMTMLQKDLKLPELSFSFPYPPRLCLHPHQAPALNVFHQLFFLFSSCENMRKVPSLLTGSYYRFILLHLRVVETHGFCDWQAPTSTPSGVSPWQSFRSCCLKNHLLVSYVTAITCTGLESPPNVITLEFEYKFNCLLTK